MTGNMTGNTFRNCGTPKPSSIRILSLKLCTFSLSFCLMGCINAPVIPDTAKPTKSIPVTSTPTLTPQTKPQPVESLGQYLPITATATLAGREIQLEVANTSSQQEKGLMFRPPLADDRGMLFPFTPARPVAFWMKNTPSPLDMIFLRDGKVNAIARNVPACKSDPCPSYPPDGIIADNVIEVRAGLTQELGLQEGDQITIKF
jgi:uncharacterized membrane protein (UPF0127 family)